MVRTAVLLLAAGLGWIGGWAPDAHAHEFWIEPSSFAPRVEEPVALELRVGERFRGDALPRDVRRIRKFVVANRAGMRDIVGVDGERPAGWLRLTRPGIHVVGYASRPTFAELEARRFETYLLEEGLESIVAERRARGERLQPGREHFSRSAKTLLIAGQDDFGREDDRAACRTKLGLPLEILPLTHPLSIPDGGSFEIRLLFEGRPMEGVRVVAVEQSQAAERIATRTDVDGTASLDLPRGGTWLIHGVHMVRAEVPDVDWSSHWASLTFATKVDEGVGTAYGSSEE